MTHALAMPPARRYAEVHEAKAGGATYTPAALAGFVADQIVEVAELSASPLRILDPAVGHGELLHSLLTRLPPGVDVEVFGFETDAAALAVARQRLSASHPTATLRLSTGSFL